jgi:membrane fusion protein, heavy metal efflux system
VSYVARLFLALLCVFLPSCSRSKPDIPPPVPSASRAADGPKRLRLSPQVVADAKIETLRVSSEVLSETVNLSGRVASDPDKTARIASPVSGRIEQVLFKEGSAVKRGDALAIVRVPELGNIRSAYAAATAKAKAARSNADRLRNLRAPGFAGEQEAIDAEAEAQALEGEGRALGEQLSALGTSAGASGALLTLRAPLSGVAISRDAVAGQPVNSEQMIGTIADLSEVWFLARVFERDLGRLHAGAKATVVLAAFPGEVFDGNISYLGREFSEATQTVSARIQLTNPKALLRIGLYGTARVIVDVSKAKTPRVVVPRNAVVDLAGTSVAFVAVGNGEYEVHEVTLGDSVQDKVEVTAGLVAGQNVVVAGAFTLKSISLKSTFAEEE